MKKKVIILAIALSTIFITASSFKSSSGLDFKRGSELDKLFEKAKEDNKELSKFEETYTSYSAKINTQNASIQQKLNSREQLHRQAKNLINSIRNEEVKKHILSIQNSYYQQFTRLKNKHQLKHKPINQELAISRDWLNAMKVAYSLEQNRLIEQEIEKDVQNLDVSTNQIKELNSKGKKIVTRMLTPAD